LPADDDEGRFFGGGISASERAILDFVDDHGNDAPQEHIDASWLRKMALNFEKRISQNSELRAKFENEPQKFIASEADLDADIKAFSIFSQYPDLYPELVRLGSASSLVGLLAHENNDIAIDSLEIIGELIDENVTVQDEDWEILVLAMLGADLVDLVVSNLGRLDEEDERDRDGVYYALTIIESLCSKESTALYVGKSEKLIEWLLQRIQKQEQFVDQNKQYAAEVLALLAQSSKQNREHLTNANSIDLLLQCVAVYRKRNPDKTSDEEEYMENLFETLTSLVSDDFGKKKFMDAEGTELCLIMIKQGKLSKFRALRLLHYAILGDSTPAAGISKRLVEAGGLKTTFTLFMRTNNSEAIEHLAGIFASLLKLLPAGSGERIRALAKFMEQDYEKVAKLIQLRSSYSARLQKVDDQYRKSRQISLNRDTQAMEDDHLSKQLDAGLPTLQTIDVVLAWLVAEDDGARSRILDLLKIQGLNLSSIRRTILAQLEDIETDGGGTKYARDMLTTLADFLFD
jgi:beta-catenin-like protein 1